MQEGYSIEAHVLMGYEQLEKFSPYFNWKSISAPPNVNVRKVLKFIYSLHDSGKPYAKELNMSHQMLSAEILEIVMNKGGFTQAEVQLGKALVGNDVIGGMLQGMMNPQEAFEKLFQISKSTNLTPRDFFKLQAFFYMVDASSYPELRVTLFENVPLEQ